MGSTDLVAKLKRWSPEIALGTLACCVFLGYLGRLELWGKREQRAAAEALDTVQHDRWLVAQIQNRPRLEKPPLPRWTIAGLMTLTGRRDEWIVRLPSAIAALGMIALVYMFGRRMGGRELGLVSGFALSSCCFFVTELRQAGNDGPLAFFVTLGLFAAWRRLHGGGESDGLVAPGERLGSRNWNLLGGAAMGLGFLCKGPVVFLVAWLTLIGYLACTKSVRRGARALVDWRAGAITLLLVASWPVPVAIVDPNAVRVWLLEMGQKTGASGIAHHSDREMFATSWFWMTLPWSLIGTAGLLLPLWRRDRADRPAVWFPWWWTVGSFVMFGTWSVAKPNYYLPCLPGVALLCGMQWLRLVRFARGGVSSDGKTAARSAQLLRAHWVALGVTAVVGPGYLIWRDPGAATWAIGVSLLAFMGVVGSVWFWRRGRDVWSFGCQAAALGAIVLLGYGSIAPRLNGINGHHDLAKRLEALTEAHSELMFFREIDEGLWFYLRDRTLVAVPNSQPRYNKDLDLMDDLKSKRYVIDWQADKQTQREQLTRQRAISDRDVLFEWLRGGRMGSGYVLMRARSYDQFMELEGGLGGRLAPVFRETGMDRTELVLLRVEPGTASASVEGQGASRR